MDTTSVQIGIVHASNLLNDNQQSGGVNKMMVEMVYNGKFSAILVFILDNDALNGNVIFLVLRR